MQESFYYNYDNSIPYNFAKTDNQILLEFNVAGFEEDELTIERKENTLKVCGSPKKKENKNYILNGLNLGSFTNTFTLREDFEVKNAKLKNGILTIFMEVIVPEEKKAKKIPISN